MTLKSSIKNKHTEGWSLHLPIMLEGKKANANLNTPPPCWGGLRASLLCLEVVYCIPLTPGREKQGTSLLAFLTQQPRQYKTRQTRVSQQEPSLPGVWVGIFLTSHCFPLLYTMILRSVPAKSDGHPGPWGQVLSLQLLPETALICLCSLLGHSKTLETMHS